MKAVLYYYSHSGHTRFIADRLAIATGMTANEIVPRKQYPIDASELERRVNQEIASGKATSICEVADSPERYGHIFLGYPVWMGRPSLPVISFINQQELMGKTVHTFYTYGGLPGSAPFYLRNVIATKKAVMADSLGIRWGTDEPLDSMDNLYYWLDRNMRKYHIY